MNPYSEIIKKVKKKEDELGLYDHKAFGVSIWRLVRPYILDRYMNQAHGYGKRDSVDKQIKIIPIIVSYLKGIIDYLSVLLRKSDTCNNIIFAFPRLQKAGETYIDKFTDPVIDNSRIKNSYLIFQRPLAGKHKTPRYHSENIYHTDFIEHTSRILGIFLLPLIGFIFFKRIKNMYRAGKPFFKLKRINAVQFGFTLSMYIISYYLCLVLFKKSKPDRVFVVNKEINLAVIASAKSVNSVVYEFQHGVTHDHTIRNSGIYDSAIDPDIFLSFGEYWEGSHLCGVPPDKIITIGWAYRLFLEQHFNNHMQCKDHHIMVISEPIMSDNIVESVSQIAQKYKEYIFDIRLHPQEQLSNSSKKIISESDNIVLQDNTIESTISLMNYRHVLGVNSSMLYEALSLNKNVGRIYMNGCTPHIDSDVVKKSFSIIKKSEDFEKFIRKEILSTDFNPFYSPFDQKKMNEIIA